MHVLIEVLEPLQARLGRALRREHDGLALLLVGRECLGDRRRLMQAGRQGEGVLHRELGAGADREVGGVGGVTEDHHVVVDPVLVADRGEADPARVVGDHAVTVEHVGEQLADQGDRLLVRLTNTPRPVSEVGEPGTPPHPTRHLDDKGRPGGVVRVAVDLHHAVRRLRDVEREGVEDLVGAEPDVLAVAYVEGGTEGVGVPLPHGRVEPVGAQDEVVRRGELGDVGSIAAEVQGHAQLEAARLEDLEQTTPAHRRERVAAAGDHLTLEVDVDVVPDRELGLHLLEHHRVGVLDPAEGLVAEHDPEAEGVVRRVALPHRDLVSLTGRRRQLLGERAEVEPARPAPDHRDPHPSSAQPG